MRLLNVFLESFVNCAAFLTADLLFFIIRVILENYWDRP